MVYHYRHRKKRKINKRVIILIISLFVLAGLVYLVFCSSVFNVRAIKISGNKELSAEEIEKNLNCQNLLLASSSNIKKELLGKIPKISDLDVKKNIFKRELIINLIEREEVAIVCKESKCFYIDKSGKVFEDAPQTSGSLIIAINDVSGRNIKLGDKIFDEVFINSVLEIKEDLFNKMDLRILNFDSMNFPVQDVKAITSERWYAFFNFKNNIKSQISALKAALSEKIKDRTSLQYIDLRIENRVYYK